MSDPYDHHRPRYHIHPHSGYLNDPNGPVVVDGRVQLFHQFRHRPGSVVLWGHQSSDDLVHWSAHRPALAPQPGSEDRDGCWSGNVVQNEQTLTAFYSGHVEGRPYQSVMAAESRDGGKSFGPPHRAIPDPAPDEHITTFRDPFVWRGHNEWLMVVGAGDDSGVASVRLYRSADLRHWRHDGNVAQLARTTVAGIDSGEMWECPQVVRFDDRVALLVSCWTHREGTLQVLALTGDAPEGRLVEPHYQRYDCGAEFYAASVLPSGPWGPVIWGWAREARTQDWVSEAGWSGVLTLPRRVAMSDSGELTSRPPSALADLRVRTLTARPMPSVDGIPAQSEIRAVIANGPGVVDLTLQFSPAERLAVTVDRTSHVVTVDRSRASQDPRAVGGSFVVTPVTAVSGDPLQLSIFLDGSIMEIFTSDGSVATIRCYPLQPPPWRLETTGVAEADNLEVHALAPATDDENH